MTKVAKPAGRRHFLHQGTRFAVRSVALSAAAGALSGLSAASARAALAPLAEAPNARALSLTHTHTHEQLALVYAFDDRYVPAALGTLNHFLRDHYTGQVGRIDPQLFDLLHRVRQVLGSQAEYEVISGYRCPETNDRLRRTRGGGVASHSLHMDGQAIDVRLPGVELADLRDAALSLRAGGVGYYPSERFVHIDTGRVRRW
jgi:uncharacterized protein YcbK (DUF882 family)